MADERFLVLLAADGSTVTDTVSTWNIALTSMPDIIPLTPKNIFTQSWFDENGSDVVFPSEVKYETAEIEMEFTAKLVLSQSSQSVYDNVSDFLNFIKGQYFTFYNESTKVGRASVRLGEVNNDAGYARQRTMVKRNASFVETEEEILKFKVKFLIDEPETNVVLTDADLMD